MISDPAAEDVELLKYQVGYLEQLLEVEEQTIVEQSARLERTLRELEQEREALRKSEERTRSIIESALDAVITVDVNGAIIGWNPAAEKILGWSRQEAYGRMLGNLIVPPEYRERHVRGLQACRETGQGLVLNKRVEMSAIHRDGRELPIELSICSVGSGDETVFSGFLRDISERRQAEQSARAREQAEIASRLKSEFLAVMSHEVRTPMNGVMGMVELLLSTDLTGEQQEYAEIIQGSASTLLTILNGILDLSKIEAGMLELESIPFDLRRVVEETAHLLAPNAAQKGLDLIIDYPPGTPSSFVGDPGRLRQVLTNLTGNAIKFTAAGHVLIKVECEQHSETAARLRLSVEDTGIGIPEDQFENIFEKFTQAGASTTRTFGGTGLGLAISKRLAELMGGAVGVTSRLDQGSTFWFTAALSRQAQTGATLLPSSPPEPMAELRHARVLVAEDNVVNQKVAIAMLEKLGCAVDLAVNGRQAVEMAEAVPYDLVFMDCQMPEMDGLEATAEIRRRQGGGCHTPIIALTASAMKDDQDRCMEAGMDGYMSKPLKSSDLRDALVRWRATPVA